MKCRIVRKVVLELAYSRFPTLRNHIIVGPITLHLSTLFLFFFFFGNTNVVNFKQFYKKLLNGKESYLVIQYKLVFYDFERKG